MFKQWMRKIRVRYTRLVLEFWRWRMLNTDNTTLRLHYSQLCDQYIVRYHTLERDAQSESSFRNCL